VQYDVDVGMITQFSSRRFCCLFYVFLSFFLFLSFLCFVFCCCVFVAVVSAAAAVGVVVVVAVVLFCFVFRRESNPSAFRRSVVCSNSEQTNVC